MTVKYGRAGILLIRVKIPDWKFGSGSCIKYTEVIRKFQSSPYASECTVRLLAEGRHPDTGFRSVFDGYRHATGYLARFGKIVPWSEPTAGD